MVKQKIILGTVQFGLDYGINNVSGKPRQEEVDEILLEANNSGIACLDTAEAYGDAHDIIGDFHRKYPSTRFEIISKLPHKLDKDLDKKIEDYLDELGVQYLTALLFHSFDTYKEHKEKIGLLNDFKREGVVKQIGVSVYTNSQFEEVISDSSIDVIQLPFNMLDNLTLRGKLLKKAKEREKIIHTRSAFLQGLFFKSIDDPSKIVQSLSPSLKRIQEISQFYSIPIRQMALGYCLAQEGIDQVLIGVDNLDQLKQNLQDATSVLPSCVIEELNSLIVTDVNLLNPAKWN